MNVSSGFHISVVGQIKSARFPLGPDGSQIFCRYEFFAGRDWELVSGLKSGITQYSNSKNSSSQELVFNMPLEVTYKATNAFGWPQIIFIIYGKNIWGVETVFGYARTLVPKMGMETEVCAAIQIPRYSHILAELSSWVTKQNPEIKDPKVLLEGTKNKGISVESYGELLISFQTISRGMDRMGYDSGTILLE